MHQIEIFSVNSHDIDINNIVRASVLLRYMQETAYMQHIENPPTLDDYRSNGRTFIISRVGMKMYLPLHAHDSIRTESWLAPSKGVTFLRCSQIFRGSELVAEMASNWAMVNIEDKKLLRVEDQTIGFSYAPALDYEVPRIRIPRGLELDLLGERKIYYSDIDLNNHMNNTNYPDMLCDFLPNMLNQRVCEMNISFQAEAPLGDTIKIYHAALENQHYFRTIRGDGKVGVEAEMLFTKISAE